MLLYIRVIVWSGILRHLFWLDPQVQGALSRFMFLIILMIILFVYTVRIGWYLWKRKSYESVHWACLGFPAELPQAGLLSRRAVPCVIISSPSGSWRVSVRRTGEVFSGILIAVETFRGPLNEEIKENWIERKVPALCFARPACRYRDGKGVGSVVSTSRPVPTWRHFFRC